ncbi:hypothetical protein ACFOOP_16395 [Marinicaulis aureus]|uniref:Uncharacterized protein n=1 Tax=Hyphococcus aureus TaxID=2666033 RepID=A0ABW1KYD4_9PROT
MHKKKQLILHSAILLSIAATSCQRGQAEAEPYKALEAQEETIVTVSQKDPVTVSQQKCSKTPEGVAGLPYSHGKVFATLDEYLAHLHQLSAIDLPYWREIRPGIYQKVVRMPEAEPQTATREELMKKYCFDGE